MSKLFQVVTFTFGFAFSSAMTDKILKSLLARCGDLCRLDISSSSSLLTDSALDVIGENGQILTSFLIVTNHYDKSSIE